MTAYIRKCYCINKFAFQHRKGTVNLYRNGAFLCAEVYNLRFFRRIKVEGFSAVNICLIFYL